MRTKPSQPKGFYVKLTPMGSAIPLLSHSCLKHHHLMMLCITDLLDIDTSANVHQLRLGLVLAVVWRLLAYSW